MFVGCIISELEHPQYPAASTLSFLISNIKCLRFWLTETGSSMGDIHNSFGNRNTRFKCGNSFAIFIGCAMPNTNKFDQWIGTYPLLYNTPSYCVLGCRRNSGASTEYYTRLVVVTALLGRTCFGQNNLYRACNLHRRAHVDGVTAFVCSKYRETTEKPCYY